MTIQDILLRRRTSALTANSPDEPWPSGYTALDAYRTESAKTFKTDFVPTKGCKVEIKVDLYAYSIKSYRSGIYFGCRDGYNNKCFYLKLNISGSSTVSSVSVSAGYKTERTITVSNDYASGEHVFSIDNGSFKIDDVVLETYTDDFEPTQPLYIIGNNSGGSLQSGTTPINVDVIFVKIYDDNGVLLRDYRPAQRDTDSVKGLLDIKNNSFLTQTS